MWHLCMVFDMTSQYEHVISNISSGMHYPTWKFPCGTSNIRYLEPRLRVNIMKTYYIECNFSKSWKWVSVLQVVKIYLIMTIFAT